MFRSLLVFLIFLISTHSFSQVNTEKFRKQLEETGFYGDVSMAAGFASGNSDFVKAKGGLRIDYASINFHSFIVGNYEFQEANEEKVVNKGFVHIRNMLSLSSVFSAELFLQKEFNQFILLEDRNLAGTGLRANLAYLFSQTYNTPAEMFLGTGLMYENELYNIEISPETNLLRSTNYLTFKWQFNESFSLIIINYFQFDLNKLRDYRFISDTSLNFLITENLVFNSAVSYRFDNEPVQDVKNYDLELTNGLTFSF